MRRIERLILNEHKLTCIDCEFRTVVATAEEGIAIDEAVNQTALAHVRECYDDYGIMHKVRVKTSRVVSMVAVTEKF